MIRSVVWLAEGGGMFGFTWWYFRKCCPSSGMYVWPLRSVLHKAPLPAPAPVIPGDLSFPGRERLGYRRYQPEVEAYLMNFFSSLISGWRDWGRENNGLRGRRKWAFC